MLAYSYECCVLKVPGWFQQRRRSANNKHQVSPTWCLLFAYTDNPSRFCHDWLSEAGSGAIRGHNIFSPIRTNLRTELPGGGAPLEQLSRVRMFATLVHLRS